MLSLNAYQNTTNRENAFNQTDFIYKTVTGPVLHTIAFGTEFGRQTGISLRNSGFFPNNGSRAFDVVNPFNPAYFLALSFSATLHQTPTANTGSTLPRAMRRTKSKSHAGCNSSSARVTTVSICPRWTRTPAFSATASTRRSRRVLR
jgi:hypothetical protein